MVTGCPVGLDYKVFLSDCITLWKVLPNYSFLLLELVYMAIICIENGNCEFMSSPNWRHLLRYKFTQDCKWFIHTILTETVSYHSCLLKEITRLTFSNTRILRKYFQVKFCKQSSVFTHQKQISSFSVAGNAFILFHCH